MNRMATILTTLCERPPQFDLACIGTPIQGFTDLSLRALACIMHADIVYYYPPSRQQLAFLRLLNTHVVDLGESHYAVGKSYSDAYQSIINEVIDAVRGGNRVVYAQQGSPAFQAFTASEILKIARSEGRNAIMLPGISSLECLMAVLAEEFALTDFQVLNAGSVASGAAVPDPRLSCFIVNLARHTSATILKSQSKVSPKKIVNLVRALQTALPKQHPIHILTIEPGGDVVNILSSVTGLSRALVTRRPTVTLFIPPTVD
jgi:precorrin-6B methylase 1